jgi:membrane-bound metal-dependent hydrolase YbcI (DUF457 family)
VFIGHNAVGFASKRIAPRTSMLWLMTAPMLLDLLWPIFLLLGIEHARIAPGITRWTPLDFYDYPWTHSLVMAIVWAVLFAAIYFAFTRYARGAMVLGAGVVSHWVLDFVVHRPDLPLWPGGPKVGLGLWNVPPATIAIEAALFAVAILIYRDTTTPVDRTGSIAFWSLIILLGALYIALASGRPPANERQLAYSALASYLIPLWAWWADRHRALTVDDTAAA